MTVDTYSNLLYAELIVFAFNTVFLFKEINILKSVLGSSTTRFLLTMLSGFWLMHLSRIIGIIYEDVLIRTYISAFFGLITGIGFINWTVQMTQLSQRTKFSLLGMTFLGFFFFFIGRSNSIYHIEVVGLALIIVLFLALMTMIMIFVFKKSPYIRARHKLFVLTISFVLFAIFEGFAVTSMGVNNFNAASLYFLGEIPWRAGITLGIVMPTELSELLRRFIK